MKAVRTTIALFSLGAAQVGCADQPKPNCLTSQSAFVMKLFEDTSQPPTETVPGACEAANATTTAFYQDPSVGLSPYYERDKKGQPDYRKGSIAIRTAELGNLEAAVMERSVPTPATNQMYSLGKFSTSEPDGDDMCTAPQLSETRVVLPELPPVMDDPGTPDEDESEPGQDAVDVTQTWSDLKVYVTPASLGTQMEVKLRDVRVAPGGAGTCTRHYKGVGLSPAVSCVLTDTKTGKPVTNPDGTPVLDPTICDAEPNPDKFRFTGSGISPSAKTVCDQEIGYCVLAGDAIPVLN